MAKKPLDDSAYLNNPNLKKVGTVHQFTAEQITEYVKCKKDPVYFTEKYIKIVNVDDGLIDFKLYDYQRTVIKTFQKHRYTIIKFPFLPLVLV
jgi:hypothetical protein